MQTRTMICPPGVASKCVRLAAALVCLLIAVAGAAPATCSDAVPADLTSGVIVMHVPAEDISKSPAAREPGAFLPLSRLLELAERAARSDEQASREDKARCVSLELEGAAGEDLRLSGTLSFASGADGWSAAEVDDGRFPWTAQSAPENAPAFLARVQGRTMLYVKGPARGVIRLEAVAPLAFGEAETSVVLGRITAPCRVRLNLARGITARVMNPGSAVPSTKSATDTSANRAIPSRQIPGELVFWPSSTGDVVLALQRSPDFTGERRLLADHVRMLTLATRTPEVQDTFTIDGRFAAGAPLEIPLPAGMRLASATCPGNVLVTATSDTVVIKPRTDLRQLMLRLVFLPHVSQSRIDLPAPVLPATIRSSRLELVASSRLVPVPASIPESFQCEKSAANRHTYRCPGALPPVSVDLAPARPLPPPRIYSALRVMPGDAELHTTVSLQSAHEDSLVFEAPEGWVLYDLQVDNGGRAVASTLTAGTNRQWRVDWGPFGRPAAVVCHMHRTGSWGQPGTTTPLELPVVALHSHASCDRGMAVSWPDELEVRPSALDGLLVRPGSELAAEFQSADTDARLALRACADRVRGTLSVASRRSAVRAQVVVALTLTEEKITARTLVNYDVSFAPENTFRFVLPRGTGRSVRLTEQGVREATLRTTAAGDEWTVVMQNGVVGPCALTAEWPLGKVDGRQSVAAPVVQVPGMLSLNGFVLVEGSETVAMHMRTSNLSEADPAEVPPLPWRRENRTVATYRFVGANYTLQIDASPFKAEQGINGVVEEAALNTTFAPAGTRLTQAVFDFSPSGARQFLEFFLPRNADLWSVLVDGEGVKPARRTDEKGRDCILVPLPPANAGARNVKVSITYREKGRALHGDWWEKLSPPSLTVPVNRTTWNLNLPPGFEYLWYGGSLGGNTVTHTPAVAYLRTAHYPDRLLFPERMGMIAIIGVYVVVCGPIAFVIWLSRRPRYADRKKAATRDTHAEASGCSFRLFELIVIMAVVAILAAIAVPNFLEAQVRSKVSRAKSDMRSLATGIESYYVDNNAYPVSLDILHQGPVKYVTAAFPDPYADTLGTPIKYLAGRAAVETARSAGYISPNDQYGDNYWMLYSVGPDGIDNGAQLIYDPTNGTASSGDIIRSVSGAEPRVQTYAETRAKEQAQAQQAQPLPYDPTNGTVSPGDIWRVPQGEVPAKPARGRDVRFMVQDEAKPAATPTPGPPPSEKPAAAREMVAGLPAQVALGVTEQKAGEPTPLQSAAAPSAPPLADVTIGDREAAQQPPGADANYFVYKEAFQFDDKVADASRGKPNVHWNFDEGDKGVSAAAGSWYQVNGVAGLAAAARSQWLLSLGIDLPRGFIEKKFEGLGGNATIEIRAMDQSRYRTVAFLSWFCVAVALAIIYLVSARLYRPCLLGLLAVCLVAPLFSAGTWSFVFNQAIYGLLVSLMAPVLYRVFRRSRTTGVSPVIIACAALAMASATQVRAQHVTDETTAVLVVPYTEDGGWKASADTPAFIGRSDFERLWTKAARFDARVTTGEAHLAGLSLEGRVDSGRGVIAGAIAIDAVNTGDLPTTIPLELNEATLLTRYSLQSSATISRGTSGLLLVLPPRWAGQVRQPFEAPYAARGAAGSFRIGLPDAAAGSWSILMPEQRVAVNSCSHPFIVEKQPQGDTIRGIVRGGMLDLAWGADQGRKESAGSSSLRNVMAALTIRGSVSPTTAIAWTAKLILNSGDGRPLPASVRLQKSATLHVLAVDGADLVSASVKDDTIDIALRSATATELTVKGYQLLDALTTASRAQSVELAAVRPPAELECRTLVIMEIADGVQVNTVEPSELTRMPATEGGDGRVVQQYEATGRGWKLRFNVQPIVLRMTATAHELIDLAGGRLRHAAAIDLQPQAGWLRQCQFALPAGYAVAGVTGQHVATWFQSGTTLTVGFADDANNGVSLQIVSDGPFPSDSLGVQPVRILAQADVERSVSLLVPADIELQEAGLNGARVLAPGPRQKGLVALLGRPEDAPHQYLRSYTPALESPLGFTLRTLVSKPLVTTFNKATLSDGMVNLDAVVRAEAKRGRIDEVRAMLVLPSPDPAAASMIRATGDVRDLETHAAGDRMVRIVARLAKPRADSFELGLHFEHPCDTASSAPVRLPFFAPAEQPSGQCYVLVHRELEGDIAPADQSRGARVTPSEVRWPGPSMKPQPSDLAFRIAPENTAGVGLLITRHKKAEALRAVVAMLRQRNTVNTDGSLMCELEIAMQNESEQFLKVELPYPRASLTIYQVLVAGREVKTAFGREKDRDVLLVPLLRTGLLEPELTVRVAYTVAAGQPMGLHGMLEQKLPTIHGGIPISRSALVLTLPDNFKYADAGGTLNRVEMIDLEVDEAVRRTRLLESISNMALFAKGAAKKAAFSKLKSMDYEMEDQVRSVKHQTEVSSKRGMAAGATAVQRRQEARLSDERVQNIKAAEQAQQQIRANVFELGRQVGEPPEAQQVQQQAAAVTVQQQTAGVAGETPTPAQARPVNFPKAGQVHAFRQVQGTGFVRLRYVSAEAVSLAWDMGLGIGIVLAVGLLMWARKRLFATPRRRYVVAVVVLLALLGAKFAWDIVVPALIVAVILAARSGRKAVSAAGDEDVPGVV